MAILLNLYIFSSLKIIIMAKLPKGILGPIIGRIGNVVGVGRLGVTYIKARPKPGLRIKIP